jgi:hypothetical protein
MLGAAVSPNVRFGSGMDISAPLINVRYSPDSGHSLDRWVRLLSAKRRHMQCSKQPVNLGRFDQVLGSLTDYNFASADEDDLSVLRSIAPSHHGYVVEIDPNGLCFEISALHPRCHSRKLPYRDYRFVPKADVCRAAKWSLFDHLVGKHEQLIWNGQTERFCRLDVDRQLKSSWLLDRNIARCRSA